MIYQQLKLLWGCYMMLHSVEPKIYVRLSTHKWLKLSQSLHIKWLFNFILYLLFLLRVCFTVQHLHTVTSLNMDLFRKISDQNMSILGILSVKLLLELWLYDWSMSLSVKYWVKGSLKFFNISVDYETFFFMNI